MFLKSSLQSNNPYKSTQEILAWLDDAKRATHHDIKKIRFDELTDWKFDDVTSNLVHSSGGYFSIEGIKVTTNSGETPQWHQPIINQP